MCNDCTAFVHRGFAKVKEERVMHFLKENGIQFESMDKRISGGCSRARPDGVSDNISFAVVTEIDEKQHETYPCECEVARMISIFQDNGGRPVLFIRFNPDGYMDAAGKKVKSYTGRETLLLKLLQSLRNVEQLPAPLIVTYLYYNGFDGTITFHAIDYEVQRVLPISLTLGI